MHRKNPFGVLVAATFLLALGWSDRAYGHVLNYFMDGGAIFRDTNYSGTAIVDPCHSAPSGVLCQSSNLFTRYGWHDGTEPTLSDSHYLTTNAEFWVFSLASDAEVTITATNYKPTSTVDATPVPDSFLNPAFSVYAGTLPDLAHDDTTVDPLNPIDPDTFLGLPSPTDAGPPGWVYAPHDGYRDTVNSTYFGQFDAFASWSMANAAGSWDRIVYVSSVSNTPCSGTSCSTTTTGGFANPGHVAGGNGSSETLTLTLAAGDYTIAVGGESGNSSNGAGGLPCSNVNGATGSSAACSSSRHYATVTVHAVPIVTGECGNGVLEAGEDCDDGNLAAGDCCSSTCTIEPASTVCRAAAGTCDAAETCTGSSATCPADAPQPNGTSCDDGNACTSDESCQGGACTGGSVATCPLCEACEPSSGCVAKPLPDAACTSTTKAGSSSLDVQAGATPAKSKLTWKWAKGGALGIAELGSPASTDPFALCVYDRSGATPSLLLRLDVPAGGTCGKKPCWATIGKAAAGKGWKFADKTGANDGVKSIVLKTGAAGKSSVGLVASGEILPLATFASWRLPVKVQLQSAAGGCQQADFSAAKKNALGKLSAKSD